MTLDPDHPEVTTRVGTRMGLETRQQLKQFLIEHKDGFAWSHKDMPGIDNQTIKHRFCVSPKIKAIRQKRRDFSTDKYTAIAEEVDRLLDLI